MNTLDAWLLSRPDRCDDCLYHPATQGHGAGCSIAAALAPIAPTSAVDAHWPTFMAALREAAVDGIVHQANVRPLIRGVIPPKIVGQCYRRARDRRVLVEVEHERSNDHEGRNAGRMEPKYELRAA